MQLKPVRDFTEFLFSLFVKQWNYFDFIRTCFVFTIVFCKEPTETRDSLLKISMHK